MPARYDATPVLTAFGLHAMPWLASHRADEGDRAAQSGDHRRAALCRRDADRMHGKYLDLLAG